VGARSRADEERLHTGAFKSNDSKQKLKAEGEMRQQNFHRSITCTGESPANRCFAAPRACKVPLAGSVRKTQKQRLFCQSEYRVTAVGPSNHLNYLQQKGVECNTGRAD
jgi:hypothetical protein